jgi:hypothetical protein
MRSDIETGVMVLCTGPLMIVSRRAFYQSSRRKISYRGGAFSADQQAVFLMRACRRSLIPSMDDIPYAKQKPIVLKTGILTGEWTSIARMGIWGWGREMGGGDRQRGEDLGPQRTWGLVSHGMKWEP